MEIKESPMCSGVSEITGKTVKVRHATEGDMVFILEKMREYDLDAQDAHFSQFVVADEAGKLAGFGRLKKVGGLYVIGCAEVVEEKKGQGLRSLIVKHLIDAAPVDLVYAVTDLTDDFKKFGFTELKEGAKELSDDLDRACRVSGKPDTVIMVHER